MWHQSTIWVRTFNRFQDLHCIHERGLFLSWQDYTILNAALVVSSECIRFQVLLDLCIMIKMSLSNQLELLGYAALIDQMSGDPQLLFRRSNPCLHAGFFFQLARLFQMTYILLKYCTSLFLDCIESHISYDLCNVVRWTFKDSCVCISACITVACSTDSVILCTLWFAFWWVMQRSCIFSDGLRDDFSTTVHTIPPPYQWYSGVIRLSLAEVEHIVSATLPGTIGALISLRLFKRYSERVKDD